MTTRHPAHLAATLLLAILAGCASGAGTSPGPAPADPAMADDALPPASIVASIDLTAVVEDRVPVEVDPGPLEDEVLFRLPGVVQGTYDVSDFGRFTEDFEAVGYGGEEVPFERIDENTWRVPDGAALDRVRYWVNDTFDMEREMEDLPFSPSGTNIDPDIFVLNLHGFVGYFEGMADESYEIRITAPVGVARSSALRSVGSETAANGRSVIDRYRADRYFDVTDNPMMYGDFETASFQVGGVDIVLSVYSPSGAHGVRDLEDDMAAMMAAQRAYLGELDTTDRYDIYLYLSADDAGSPMGYGALEHQTSTVVVMPEWLTQAQLAEEMINIVAHEFFHVVTPLAVHSEDIQDFDYAEPTFSKHLWMYEGVTEYFANHFQVHEGLETRDEFYRDMAEKIEFSHEYDDEMSFTLMSENIVDEPYAENYGNVYQKGALIGMCIDVALVRESGGARSLIDFMRELSEIYGPGRPFEDDTWIDEITERTYPSVGDFLVTHVVGDTPIDYGSCIEPAGLTVTEEVVPTTLFFLDDGQTPFIDIDPVEEHIFVRGIGLNSTLETMGLEADDIIRSVNGTAYDLANVAELIQASVGWTAGTQLQMVVERDGEEVVLTGTHGTPSVVRYRIEEVPGATVEQLGVRNAWLGG